MQREATCLRSSGNKKFPWNGKHPRKMYLIRLPWSTACKHFKPKKSRGWKWWPNAWETLQILARAEHHCIHTEKKGLLVYLLWEVQSQGRLRIKIISHRSFRLNLAHVPLVQNLSTLHWYHPAVQHLDIEGNGSISFQEEQTSSVEHYGICKIL